MSGGFDPTDLHRVHRPAIEAALTDLSRGLAFHTRDIVEHREVQLSHRTMVRDEDFPQLLAAYLRRNAVALGVVGPLAGTPSLGDRWAFTDVHD